MAVVVLSVLVAGVKALVVSLLALLVVLIVSLLALVVGLVVSLLALLVSLLPFLHHLEYVPLTYSCIFLCLCVLHQHVLSLL